MKLNKQMKTTMSLAALAALAGSASGAFMIVGPNDVAVDGAGGSHSQGADVETVDLNGEDALYISYGITREDTSGGGSWLTVSINESTDSQFGFTTGGVLGGLVSTETNSTAAHAMFQASSGSWDGGLDSSVDFDAASPAEHQVLLTITGLSSGGFNGVHNFTFEIDHNASTFGSADRTFTGTLDFGADDILDIDFSAFQKSHTAADLTVSQVPEPTTTALLGLGGLALILRRRK